MTLYERMRSERERLAAQNETLEQQLALFPRGKLLCCKEKTTKVKWYVRDQEKLTYLPKKERRQAELLARKKLYQAQIDDNLAEIRAIDYYLTHHKKDYCNQEKVMSDAGIQNLLSTDYGSIPQELEAWAKAPYARSEKYPEKLTHPTLAKIKVRSKSEQSIANLLHMHGIPFRYEEATIIGGITYYPDFKVRRLYDGKEYIWEHLGIMDDHNYIGNSMQKLRTYAENGIVPSVNLILTYETGDHPLDSELVEKMIAHYLL